MIVQQPKNSLLLEKVVVAPAQAVGLTSPAGQSARGSIMGCLGSAGLQLPGSTCDTTVNIQLAFGSNPGILPIDTSTIAGVGVATWMSNTVSSLVLMGSTATVDGGSYKVSVFSPAPTHFIRQCEH